MNGLRDEIVSTPNGLPVSDEQWYFVKYVNRSPDEIQLGCQFSSCSQQTVLGSALNQMLGGFVSNKIAES